MRIPPNQGHEPPFTPLRGKILHLHHPRFHRVNSVYLADGTMDDPCKEEPLEIYLNRHPISCFFTGAQNVALSTFPIILPFFSLFSSFLFIVHHCGEWPRDQEKQIRLAISSSLSLINRNRNRLLGKGSRAVLHPLPSPDFNWIINFFRTFMEIHTRIHIFVQFK